MRKRGNDTASRRVLHPSPLDDARHMERTSPSKDSNLKFSGQSLPLASWLSLPRCTCLSRETAAVGCGHA